LFINVVVTLLPHYQAVTTAQNVQSDDLRVSRFFTDFPDLTPIITI